MPTRIAQASRGSLKVQRPDRASNTATNTGRLGYSVSKENFLFRIEHAVHANTGAATVFCCAPALGLDKAWFFKQLARRN
jgi:hypothetical protein